MISKLHMNSIFTTKVIYDYLMRNRIVIWMNNCIYYSMHFLSTWKTKL